MKLVRLAKIAAAGTALAMGLAATAYADVDTDFANQLHNYGIYGQRDYNAWMGKIVCKRLGNHEDADAAASVHFILTNLPRGTTQVQAWQFLGAAITTYCPDLTPVWQNASMPPG